MSAGDCYIDVNLPESLMPKRRAGTRDAAGRQVARAIDARLSRLEDAIATLASRRGHDDARDAGSLLPGATPFGAAAGGRRRATGDRDPRWAYVPRHSNAMCRPAASSVATILTGRYDAATARAVASSLIAQMNERNRAMRWPA